MANFDEFSGGGFEPRGFGGQSSGGPLDSVKEMLSPILPHWKKILALLVFLIVVFFVYDFFIGGIVEVNVSIKDTESKVISAASGSVLDSKGSKVLEFSSGIISGKLREGTYSIEFNPIPKHKALSQEITVTRGGVSPSNITLSKDFDLDLLDFSFPDLSIGEEKEFALTRIKNKDQKKLVELSFDLDGKEFKDVFESTEFVPSTFPLSPNGEDELKLRVKVKDSYRVKDKSKGDELKGQFLIKGLLKSDKTNKEFSFRVFPKPETSINPTGTLSMDAKAGADLTKDIKITNKGSIKIEKIQISIELADVGENSKDDFLNWFSLTGCENIKNCFIDISADKQNNEFIGLLKFSPPATARQVLGTGYLVVKKDQSVLHKLLLEVKLKEAEILVSALLRPLENNYKLRRDSSGNPEKKQVSLDLENKGDLDVSKVDLQVKQGSLNDFGLDSCESTSIINIPQKTANIFPIDLKRKGSSNSKFSVPMTFSFPDAAEPSQKIECLIEVSFEDPKTRTEVKIDPPILFSIESG